MIVHEKRRLLDELIDHLPFELHIPNYQYCGPGANLANRLAPGDQGINKLDAACKDHDIAYKSDEIETRRAADRILTERAWQRVLDKDVSLGERADAYAVTNLLKVKSKLGIGLAGRGKKKKNTNLKNIISLVKKQMLKPKNNS